MTTKKNPKVNDRKAPQSVPHTRKDTGAAKGHHNENDARQPASHDQQGNDHNGVAAKAGNSGRRGHHGEAKERVHEDGHHGTHADHPRHGRHPAHAGKG